MPYYSPPHPAGVRNCNGATFASFKKYASHFLNPDFVGTEPKEAPNAVTGENSKNGVFILKCIL